MILTIDLKRWLLLGVLMLGFALVCLAPWLRERRKRAAPRRAAGPDCGWIVAHASQTGNAEQLAAHTAATLRLAGVAVRLCPLAELDAASLQAAERVLFVVSTYGEGDAPDAAVRFVSRVMDAGPALGSLHYAVLALGDRGYTHFCGFGRALDQWLREQGAQRLFPRIEVDRGAEAALEQWRQQLSHLAGSDDTPDWAAPAFSPWLLRERRLLNPGSAGAPLYHLELAPRDGPLPDWESGDLVQLEVPADPGRPREYSIASLPAEGRVHLLLRLHRHEDGSVGQASGWLALQAAVGGALALRLHPHRRFRLEHNAARPLILIGNGSGLAGLRGHLMARAAAGQHRNWLLYGERNAAFDSPYREQLRHWQEQGVLARLDLVYSRDQPQRLYVQDRLREQAARLRAWLDEGAAVYVCGSLAGMAAGVDQVLEQALGRPALEQLAAEGRYRRDVY